MVSTLEFLISYELGKPLWNNPEYTKFKLYPSILWKQYNVNKLKQVNLSKHKQGVQKLSDWLQYENSMTNTIKKANPTRPIQPKKRISTLTKRKIKEYCFPNTTVLLQNRYLWK
jgi:hypothetical protein